MGNRSRKDPVRSPDQAEQRARQLAEAFAMAELLADGFEDLSGFTLILPDGSTTFVPAEALRRRGRPS